MQLAVAPLGLAPVLLGLLAVLLKLVQQCGLHPREAGQHHGVTAGRSPFIPVGCPVLLLT